MGRKGGRDKAAVFVDALVETGVRQLVGQLGVAEDDARSAMHEIARSICWQYARQEIYVPVDMEWSLSERDRRMWQAYGQHGPDGVKPYTAARVAQIAQAEQLTVVHVYRIFKLAQRREMAARQGTLPGLEPDADGG